MSTRNETLSKANFDRLRNLVYDECGINLGPDKRTMVEIRLQRRLRTTGLSSVAEYCNHVFAPGGSENELVHLIDAVTTNKTDFFREPEHFTFLVSKALPDLVSRRDAARTCLIWSAGCSSGEEPYTLAIVLSEYAQAHAGFHFSVLATDICTAVLTKAADGIYKSESVKPVPVNLQRKYFMRSRALWPSADRSRSAGPGRVSAA